MTENNRPAVTIEPPLANKMVAFGLAAVGAFVVLVFITNVDAALFQLLMVLGGIAIAIYAYRTIRSRATASHSGITVHNLRRTVTLGWGDIDHLAVTQLKGNQGTGLEVVASDGTKVPVEASWGPWYATSKASDNTLRCEKFISEIDRLRSEAGHGSADHPSLPTINVTWLTVFADLPADLWDTGAAFWTRSTRTKLSEPRGEHGEFATLRPSEGDPYLKMQLIDGPPRVHVDIHVDSIEAATERATGLGATVVAKQEHVVLTSPGGFVFCLVGDGGEAIVPPPEDSHTPNRLDQVCLDIPSAAFERECAFWASLTGWHIEDGSRVEFRSLERPDGIPLRILFQRLGREDHREDVSAHVDFAGSTHVTELMMRHMRYDSTRVANKGAWIVMRDPTGLMYCITARDPEPGSLG